MVFNSEFIDIKLLLFSLLVNLYLFIKLLNIFPTSLLNFNRNFNYFHNLILIIFNLIPNN